MRTRKQTKQLPGKGQSAKGKLFLPPRLRERDFTPEEWERLGRLRAESMGRFFRHMGGSRDKNDLPHEPILGCSCPKNVRSTQFKIVCYHRGH